MQKKLPFDFIMSFCREMIPDNGEDNYCYSFCDDAGLIGVFDGCGGAGARKHGCYSGKTEAYIASRICAGAFYDSFRRAFPGNYTTQQLIQEVAKCAIDRLVQCQPPTETDGLKIGGSMVRTLPTTVAAALIRQTEGTEVDVSAIWAGDSRVFLLDTRGLAQLTVDNTSVPDPMENAYEDGILRNIFCSDRKVRVHHRTIRVNPPFAVLAATDGCFGYVSTPMEFEGMLLYTLLCADTPAQWEANLADMIGGVAGDDYTMCLASLGFENLETLKASFSERYAHILQEYLNPVSELPVDDRQSRFALWSRYRTDYMRYLEDGQA